MLSRIANRLINEALVRRIMSSGQVFLSNKFEKEFKSHISEIIEKNWTYVKERIEEQKRGVNLKELEEKGMKIIKETDDSLQHDLEKELKEFLRRIKELLDNFDDGKKYDLYNDISNRYRYYTQLKNLEYFNYQRFLFRQMLDAVDNIGGELETGDWVKEQEVALNKELERMLKEAEKFNKKLIPLARELNINLKVTPYFDEKEFDIIYAEGKEYNLGYDVKIEGTDLGVSVFLDETNKLNIDDVIDDPDFFRNSEDQIAYDGLIYFLRTGKLPKEKPVKFIQLYRAMSSEELQKWSQGHVIPKNKYFTDKYTSSLAYDDPDLEKKKQKNPDFSYGIERFSVRNDCVVERDAHHFITVKECKMNENGKIVPIE